MPSVGGMRRSTRVFGVIKGVDGARVLRSGRRLWIGESVENNSKFRRANDIDDEWLHTMIKNHHHHDNNTPVIKYNKDTLWTRTQTNVSKLKKERSSNIAGTGSEKVKKVNDNGNKRYGIVYSRKRRRVSFGIEKQETFDKNNNNKKFGIKFSRRQRRKDNDGESFEPAVLGILVDGSCTSSSSSSSRGLAASFLHLVLGYIKRNNLSASELLPFLFTESVSSAFASHGIRFLQDPTANREGICKIFRARSTVPIFSLDFSAVPFSFVYMHLRLAFKVKSMSLEPVNNSLDEDSCDEVTSESEEDLSFGLLVTDTFPETDNAGSKVSLHPSMRASKLGRRSQYRNVLNPRGIQKRRSSFRRRRARNLSVNGSLVSDLISSKKNGIPFSSVVSMNKLRRSVRITPPANLKEVSPTVVDVTRAVDPLSSCSANLLVIESDRCYRMEGVMIMLEISDSGEWVLVVKKDGLTRYTHFAQKNMRPCSSNRITHDIIWTGDDSWKLEFPNREDWLVFKDLYKECSDRNVPATISKAIPVPGVHEVLGYKDSSSLPFSRPEAYICMNNDEVGRALAKKTSNYDMDCEDEEWLNKFNSELFIEFEHQEHLSEEKFELMIDTFERAFYSSPDDFTDVKAAVNFCIDLGRREVVEAVYGYWMKKRKQRRTVLLRVFQLHQGKKASLIPKPGLRKRRSFKRQASQFGRGKQPSLLQAMAAEHDAWEEQNAMRNVEAAKASAKSSVESAILKRRRAQMLMENADLAVYKASMALRIAEASSLPNSTDIAETLLLD